MKVEIRKIDLSGDCLLSGRWFYNAVVIPEPYTIGSVIGLSLEEIEERHGKERAQEVYSSCAMGLGDETKASTCNQSLPVKRCVDVEVTIGMIGNPTRYELSVDLLGNPFINSERERKHIGGCVTESKAQHEFFIGMFLEMAGIF